MGKKDKQETLQVLCDLDKRVIKDETELESIAKMYNVKACLHKHGANPRKVNLRMYQHIRRCAVGKAIKCGGATVKQLCDYLDQMSQHVASNSYISSM